MHTRHVLNLLVLAGLLVGLAACDFARMALSEATPTVNARPTATPPPTVALAPTAEQSAAIDLQAKVIQLYETVGPSVVFISSKVIQYDFFMQPVPQEGSGSGFVYDSQGHIVTNYHVVAGASEVSVAFASGESYPAEVIGEDPSTDLAVLKVNAKNLPRPLVVTDSSKLQVGQFVVAIGNPFGLERTMTLGIISALGRVIESPNGRFIGEAIQTDAAINPGNSGGPMLNLQGEVIGVNSQIISPSGANAGIGFAISANTVRRVVPALIAQGRYPHPWLGVSTLTITRDIRELFQRAGMDIPVERGVIVLEVVPQGPAASAGIRGGDRIVRISGVRVPLGGDIIIAVKGQRVTSTQDLTVILETQTRVGDTVDVKVVRGGRELTIPVKLTERPQD